MRTRSLALTITLALALALATALALALTTATALALALTTATALAVALAVAVAVATAAAGTNTNRLAGIRLVLPPRSIGGLALPELRALLRRADMLHGFPARPSETHESGSRCLASRTGANADPATDEPYWVSETLCGQERPPACSAPPPPVGRCGVSSCTATVLATVATAPTESATCGGRIAWVEDVEGKSEPSACQQVAEEFPEVCGGCAPFGLPPLPPSPPPGLAVLMMGNSYTYYNGGVNGVLLQLLAALGDSPRVQALTKGGSSLNYHWQEVSSPSSGHHVALASGFDFVVLQDRSDIPSRCCYTDQDEDFEASTRALVQLDAAIKEAGATTVLYQTWGRRGSLNRPPHFQSFLPMNDAVEEGYRRYASLITTDGRAPIIAPVGSSFELVYGARYGADRDLWYRLYDRDATHPSALSAPT